jgi:hypothetical protein
MPQFELVKIGNGTVRGHSQDDLDKIERYKRFRERLEPGEFYHLKYWQSPDPVLHRRLMALFRLGFDHWEPERARKRLTFKGMPIEKNYDQFRKMVTIRAGYYEQFFDLKGRMQLEAQSLKYDEMTDDEKRELLSKVIDVLLDDVLTNYKREDVERVVEQIQRFG